MRLIDSDKFLQDMAELYRQAGWDEREVHFSLADLRSNIGMEDTILIPQREADVVPVKHARWIDPVHGVYKCSNCRSFLDFSGVNAGRGDANYCPNCGAKMDEEIEWRKK